MRRVVVTGFGVVSPIGNSRSAFFRGLTESRSGIAEITGFDARSFPTRIAAEVVDPLSSIEEYKGEWEAALKRDRKSRFGLIAAREAHRSSLGGARVLPYDPRRIGASIAAGLELFDVRDLLRHLKHGQCDGTDLLREALTLDCHEVGSVPADVGAQAIRDEFALNGPFGVVLSACAAGTQAIGEAFLAIRDDVADAMVAGGYDSMINPLGLGGFCLLEAMSRRNDLGRLASRPFDAARDGFVLGEGAAMFVLEEYESALRRGATILAEIEGYGSSLDAYRVTDPEPDGRGAMAAMAQALAMANVTPRDLDYVNAHGTGTPKNDPVEARAIREILGSDVDRVYVSSTKSQIGHLIGAAGAVEFAACLYALREQQVPATITLEHPDPECHLRHVARQPIQVPVRRVLSNSLGFGGQNASIVLGQPPISTLGEP